MLKNTKLRLENDTTVREDLHNCYYLSKPVIRAMGSDLIKTLNKFNHNMIYMLQQHEKRFDRLTSDMIINQTKWIHQNYNLFPNEQYFNRKVLNVTLPCYSIDVNFVNIETFTKDLSKTLVGCNIVEGSGANYKTPNPIDIEEKDLKWLEYDIDMYYELIEQIKDLKAKTFIEQVLSMIKQNRARYSDVCNIVRKIGIRASQEDIDIPVDKDANIYCTLKNVDTMFLKSLDFLQTIDPEGIIKHLQENNKKWDNDLLAENFKKLFNGIDEKLNEFINNILREVTPVEKYVLLNPKTYPEGTTFINYKETLSTHPGLAELKDASIFNKDEIELIKTSISNMSNYKGQKIEENTINAYISSFNRLIDVIEHYNLGINSQIWEHIGCKEDNISTGYLNLPPELKFGKI